MNDDAVATSILEALTRTEDFGYCLFDEAGRVTGTSRNPLAWMPKVGESLYQNPFFLGLNEAILKLKGRSETLQLPSIRLGGEKGSSYDIRIIWVAGLNMFAAVSHAADERMALEFRVAQVSRENRLLQERVKEQQDRIAEQYEMMKVFIKHVPAPVIMLDADLNVIMVSESWKLKYGDIPLQNGKCAFRDAFAFDTEAWGQTLRLALDNGVTSGGVEKMSWAGSIVWLRWEQTPWRRADWSIGGTIVFADNVTSTIAQRSRMRQVNDQLYAAMGELERVGAWLKGDVQAPLRQIGFFAQFLIADHLEQLDAVGREHVLQIASANERAKSMLDAVARYAQVTIANFIMTPLDVSDIVDNVVAKYDAEIKAKGARLKMGRSAIVRGEPQLLAQLLEELVSNTLKYAVPSPRMTLDCIEDEDSITLAFTDDGPGIAAHESETAFTMFQRNGARNAIAGVGAGLAIARKIAERHGGTMVIDSEFDAGLRIYINLPKAPIKRGH